MDIKTLNNLSYGVFLLSTKYEGKINGCITDTCMQVAFNPVRIGIACTNSNYTCELLKKSGVFTLSILDKSCGFELIKHFGYQSGRTVDKFKNYSMPVDSNGIPYLDKNSCGYISARVTQSVDLGTHTLFVAEIFDAAILGDKKPMTYAWYQSNVKPKL